ncbi:MAG: hypothetical protein CW342_04835 [Thermoactinomycetaceae bacterium]|nr:hypothetical protein [Thermoactinomycetaceae bacterium]
MSSRSRGLFDIGDRSRLYSNRKETSDLLGWLNPWEVCRVSLEIGLRLKEARESLGLSIQDIRDKTRIEIGYLMALENGEFDKLPSPYFVRTCIRQYAKCVGIEPHHLLKKYRPIPGESGSQDAVKKRNTDRQKAVQDRSRFTSTHPRISPRGESGDALEGEGGSRSFTQRTMRMESLSRTNAKPGTGHSPGDADSYGSPSRREFFSDTDRVSGDPTKSRNTGRQRTIQDLSRTSKFSRLSSRGEPDAAGEAREGADRSAERTMRLELKRGSGAGYVSGDTDSPDEERESPYRYSMERSSRSRRSERAQEGETSRKIRRIGMVAGIALLIPAAAWGAYAFLKDDPPAETRSASEQSDPDNVNAEPLPQESDSPEDEGKEAEVSLVEKSGGVAHYQIAATGELSVEIGPAADVCWVQIREQPEGGKYLKDVTLRNNETYKYQHPADGSSNLYIEFGAPQAIKQIKVNGQPIEASKMIRIERSE